jgi:hypothetical protein
MLYLIGDQIKIKMLRTGGNPYASLEMPFRLLQS